MSKENEKAFPVSDTYDTNEGMDLRDYFAAKAMQGIINTKQPRDYHWGNGVSDNKPKIAALAYGMADAMMEERSKTDK
jgi:hypothetical protein